MQVPLRGTCDAAARKHGAADPAAYGGIDAITDDDGTRLITEHEIAMSNDSSRAAPTRNRSPLAAPMTICSPSRKRRER